MYYYFVTFNIFFVINNFGTRLNTFKKLIIIFKAINHRISKLQLFFPIINVLSFS